MFYVDDNKISHKNEKVLTKVINKLEGHFGKLEISRGREHNFLGMRIKFIGDEVHISMTDFIREAIDMFPKPTSMRPENWCPREKKSCPGIAQPAFRQQHKLLTFY